jgi:prepilin-type N-terminal cleavage/methylation domain-containing protein
MKIGTSDRRAGFTLLEIMLVVAIIGMLAAIAIPNFIRARARSTESACINNLRQIESAKAQWAMEFKSGGNSQPTDTDLFGVGMYLKKKPVCGAGGQYAIEIVSQPPTCTVPNHKLN